MKLEEIKNLSDEELGNQLAKNAGFEITAYSTPSGRQSRVKIRDDYAPLVITSLCRPPPSRKYFDVFGE